MIVVLNLFDIVPGRQRDYARYLRLVQPILDRYEARVLLYGLTKMVYMGPCCQEYCGLIAYQDVRSLRELSRDPEFLKIRHLRDESTCNYVMTAIQDFPSMAQAADYLENHRGGHAGATGADPPATRGRP